MVLTLISQIEEALAGTSLAHFNNNVALDFWRV